MSDISAFLNYLEGFGRVFSYTWFIILPIAFFYIFKVVWLDYARVHSPRSWVKGLQWVLLEVVPSRNIESGPKLMESIYAGLTGVLTTYNVFDTYLKGAFTDRFSLELVGEDGKAHFYIRTMKKYRNLVEAQVYAQYPDAEIIQVPDYTTRFPKVVPNKYWDLWGTDFEFIMAAPFPIRTYDKFEEDITGTMIDPMAALVEVIGTLSPGQNIWLQYVLEPLPEKWKNEQIAVINKLKGVETPVKKGFLGDMMDVFFSLGKALLAPVEFKAAEKKDQPPLEFRLTPVEKEILKAVEENLGRNSFKVKMRFLYLGKRESFDKTYVSAFIGAIKQFNDLNMNQVKPNDTSKTYANYLFKKERQAMRQRKIYNRYKSRNMDGALVVFSTKELATVFHFPDLGVKSPSVLRTASKLGTAPPNLPVR